MKKSHTNNMATVDFLPPKEASYYPSLIVPHIQNPNRFWAIPVLGGLVKIISLIPVFIEIILLAITMWIFAIINAFFVLFTGKYWQYAFDFMRGFLCLQTKVSLFLSGLTNTYPGFNFDLKNTCELTITMPTQSNRLFAIPLFGLLARLILMIPYFIFSTVISYAANIAAIIASFPVCFSGKYPESMYEMVRDNVRISLAITLYIFGLSDTYPNFWISMHNKNTKIALIIAGALLAIMNSANNFSHHQTRSTYYNQQGTTPNTTYYPTK